MYFNCDGAVRKSESPGPLYKEGIPKRSVVRNKFNSKGKEGMSTWARNNGRNDVEEMSSRNQINNYDSTGHSSSRVLSDEKCRKEPDLEESRIGQRSRIKIGTEPKNRVGQS